MSSVGCWYCCCSDTWFRLKIWCTCWWWWSWWMFVLILIVHCFLCSLAVHLVRGSQPFQLCALWVGCRCSRLRSSMPFKCGVALQNMPLYNNSTKRNPKLKTKMTSLEVLDTICASQEPTSAGRCHYKKWSQTIDSWFFALYWKHVSDHSCTSLIWVLWIGILDLNQPFKMKVIWGLQSWTLGVGVPGGDFWAKVVEIQAFPSPTGYMLTTFGFYFINLTCFL